MTDQVTLPNPTVGWDERAECRRHDGDLWFATAGVQIRAAKALCRTRCPVRRECDDPDAPTPSASLRREPYTRRAVAS